jgi:hypothetical protein
MQGVLCKSWEYKWLPVLHMILAALNIISGILASRCSLPVVVFWFQRVKGGIHECNTVSAYLIYFIMFHIIMHIKDIRSLHSQILTRAFCFFKFYFVFG